MLPNIFVYYEISNALAKIQKYSWVVKKIFTILALAFTPPNPFFHGSERSSRQKKESLCEIKHIHEQALKHRMKLLILRS